MKLCKMIPAVLGLHTCLNSIIYGHSDVAFTTLDGLKLTYSTLQSCMKYRPRCLDKFNFSMTTVPASQLIKYSKLHQRSLPWAQSSKLVGNIEKMRTILLFLTFLLGLQAKFILFDQRYRQKRFRVQESWLSGLLHKALSKLFQDFHSL